MKLKDDLRGAILKVIDLKDSKELSVVLIAKEMALCLTGMRSTRAKFKINEVINSYQ